MCDAEEISYDDLMNLKSVDLLNRERQKTQHSAPVGVSSYIKSVSVNGQHSQMGNACLQCRKFNSETAHVILYNI